MMIILRDYSYGGTRTAGYWLEGHCPLGQYPRGTAGMALNLPAQWFVSIGMAYLGKIFIKCPASGSIHSSLNVCGKAVFDLAQYAVAIAGVRRRKRLATAGATKEQIVPSRHRVHAIADTRSW
jgi:hypothetical protein